MSTLQADVSTWPVPSLVRVRGTALGGLDYSSYLTSDGRFGIIDGKPRPLTREQWKPMRMEDQFDAILYLGPSSTMTFQQLSPDRCRDRAYIEMRTRRMALVPQARQQIDRLTQYCATQVPQ